MRNYFCLILFVFSLARIVALPPQKLIYQDHWVYDALTAISLEQSLGLLAGSALTIAQVEVMLSRVDESSLSPGGKN
ncbi:MAG: hypothetical protein LBI06_00010 [Treponema sp.]|jgi:hypothetical protein|nr:hypothetical protein [Treponema sp.]